MLTATCDFTATIDGHEFACKAGDKVEGEKSVIMRLTAAGVAAARKKEDKRNER